MPKVRPFVGLRFDPGVAGPLQSLTAPPYDVITPAAQDRLYGASPFNVVRLILGRDEPGDDDRENKYTRGASLLRTWLADGVLVPTDAPCVYPYELSFRTAGRRRTLRGLIVEMNLEPFGPTVVPHERILPEPLDDRLRLLRAVPANLSPVYAVVAGPCPALGDLVTRARSAPPAVDVVDEEGTGHRLWAVDGGFDDALAALDPEAVMIADGHHRYTVALRHREEMRSERGPGPWDAMMMFLVDAATEDPPVLPIHRVVRERIAARPGERPVRDLPETLADLRDEDLSYGVVEGHDGTLAHRVGTLPGTPPTVCALHVELLDAVDPHRIDYVPDAVAAEAAAAASGRDRTAFLLPPTRVDRVWRVAAAGGVLPQKSTYFWPKPRTGLVIRPLAPPG
jgi:uncharacterized protein (DUF1015 family)